MKIILVVTLIGLMTAGFYLKANSTEILTEEQVAEILETVPQLEKIEADFIHLQDADIQKELAKAKAEMARGQYIEKAQAGTLTLEGHRELTYRLRKLTALRKIVLDRAFEEGEGT
jgi:hypothetical protein